MGRIIKTEKICKYFGTKATRVKAIDDVSIEIESGEFVAIVGPSGSGKSTLLHLVGALQQPSSGTIYLANKNIKSMSGSELSDFRRDRIGFVFQAYNLIPVLSVEENVEYILVLQGVEKRERKKRVAEVLEKLDILDKIKRKPSELSGGQQQRVAVARALVSKPKLILADEPTANLDSTSGQKLMNNILQLNTTEHVTFVFTTHDPHMMTYAKRVIHLKDGRLDKL